MGDTRQERSVSMPFVRDPAHWLNKLSPDEWIRAATGELRRAEEAYQRKNGRAGLAGARRAAGMALNGALIVHPDESWGRSYMDHLLALKRDTSELVPARVRDACLLLLETPLPGGELVALRTSNADDRVLEAARDVIAHAYAIVKRNGDLV
jgi:HEPN domain-containing protein